MRHHNQNRKFGLETGKRRAFVRSLVRALVLEERIKTTEARAKELRPITEKLITLAKRNIAKKQTLTALRTISSDMAGQPDVTRKLVRDLAPRYESRNGGYTRVLKLPPRKSDGAKMALIEFV